MKTIGIITIHKIYNYGSVLQAYALQKVCENLGYKVVIIDYNFPNAYQQGNKYRVSEDTQPNEPRWIKALFARELIKQHHGIDYFVKNNLHLSSRSYSSPHELEENVPIYDVYLTGSDQVWNPRHTNGDPSFMLHFAPSGKIKLSYASSIGSNKIPNELTPLYSDLLSRYNYISVREESGRSVINELIGKEADVVLDPTLLLASNEWNIIATSNRLVKKKYILCYFLNYSFNAFPFVDNLATSIQRQTGYEIVRVARPPHHMFLRHTKYYTGASPEDFLALVRDAEIVLTTSFHGTAFAVNYGKPVFSIVKDFHDLDSRQLNLMKSLGLEDKIVTIKEGFPDVSLIHYDLNKEQKLLGELRQKSLLYLNNALKDARD